MSRTFLTIAALWALAGALLAACAGAPAHNVGELELKWPPAGERVDATPVLQWLAFPGAARYRVVVIDEDATSAGPMLDQITNETQLAVTAPLAPGGYRWTVQGQSVDAVVLAELHSEFVVKARLQLLEPADGASVGQAPVLRWAGIPGAAQYQIVVVDSEAYPPVVALERTTADTTLAIAPPLRPGGSYSLTVRALDAQGLVLAESNSMVSVQRSAIELKPCALGGVPAQCGTYQVYENRVARSGRMIDLRLALLPATSAQRAADPIFYLAGGPGGAAVDALPSVGPALAALNERRDLVFVDQRGTGGSNKLVCPEPGSPLDQSEPATLAAYVRACLDALPAEPSWYTTRAFVDDLDEVRQALGYDQINIVGGSYGATSAQVYLLYHEATVRSMTLMGGTLLDIPILERLAWSSQRALDMVLARCAGDQACSTAFPDARAELKAALAQLEQQPITTDVIDPQSGKRVIVTREVFASAVHEMLMGADTAAQIPRMVHRALALNDWDALADMYASRLLAHGTEGARLVMSAVIRCGEPWAAYDPAEVARASGESYLAERERLQSESIARICQVVPRPAPEALYGPTQVSMVPVLMLSGTEDPQNPPENVAGMQAIYPNSRALLEPHRGHYTVNWFCITSVVAEFITGGRADNLQAACLSKVRPYPFDVRP